MPDMWWELRVLQDRLDRQGSARFRVKCACGQEARCQIQQHTASGCGQTEVFTLLRHIRKLREISLPNGARLVALVILAVAIFVYRIYVV
jgi:hypothetical protein